MSIFSHRSLHRKKGTGGVIFFVLVSHNLCPVENSPSVKRDVQPLSNVGQYSMASQSTPSRKWSSCLPLMSTLLCRCRLSHVLNRRCPTLSSSFVRERSSRPPTLLMKRSSPIFVPSFHLQSVENYGAIHVNSECS